MRKTVCFVTSAHNNGSYLKECYESLKEQTNPNWEWVILNDMSTDDTFQIANEIVMSEDGKRERVVVWNHDRRKFPLKGIYDYLKNFNDFSDQIIAVLDGSDSLCNENTVDLILKEYNNNPHLDALWTAHSWDINSVNYSKELPGNINPYQYPWVSSHLKTFKVSTFKKIRKSNFKNLDGDWFQEGWEQAIYLPVLYLARERKFLNEICYLFKANTKNVSNRKLFEKEKHATIKLLRSRGFLK